MIRFSFEKSFERPRPAPDLLLEGEFAKDSVTAVVGKSGSGKTSLALMMAGLLRSDCGIFTVGEAVLEDTRSPKRFFAPPQSRGIGFVFQNHRLFPAMTVRGNILFGTRHGRRRAPVAFDDVVELLQLGSLLERRPDTLSGGQAQRVSLARALMSTERLLIMDEPTASLDSHLRHELTEYVARIRELSRLTVLYITHHSSEALAVADAALALENGRIVDCGDAKDVITRYEAKNRVRSVPS